MKKLFSLIIACSAIISLQAQNLGALTAGTNAGALVSSASSNAMRQLTQLYTTNKTAASATALNSATAQKAAAPNLSQLQLLGIDPTNIAKFYRDNAAADNSDNSGLVSLLTEIADLRTRQEQMQLMLDSANAKLQVPETKPNEIFVHDFFSSGKLALFMKSSENKARILMCWMQAMN